MSGETNFGGKASLSCKAIKRTSLPLGATGSKTYLYSELFRLPCSKSSEASLKTPFRPACAGMTALF
jgi:hypothetical protein